MKPKLHEAVHEIVLDIVNASHAGDRRTEWDAHRRLESLCELSEQEGDEHPFQWETLGDFTADRAIAIRFYERALRKARIARLDEYVSSICLAMAEAHLELGDTSQAMTFAIQADDAAQNSSDLELRRSISELLLMLSSAG
ncbi:hypothetical protein [Pseudomonas solani]|uniref:hypothetical protein n=1 Tax=Pseudomonas solani TaxID=2731552 RepID=UPI003D6A33A2